MTTKIRSFVIKTRILLVITKKILKLLASANFSHAEAEYKTTLFQQFIKPTMYGLEANSPDRNCCTSATLTDYEFTAIFFWGKDYEHNLLH
jgi:hypothetical protein